MLSVFKSKLKTQNSKIKNPMLYFISNYSQKQLISSGSPFSGDVVPALKSLELHDLFGDITSIDSLSVSEVKTAGPSGSQGVLMSVGAKGIRPDAARYLPEQQAWKQVSSAVWIGTDAGPVSGGVQASGGRQSPDGASPTPERLARENCAVSSFENVILADGNIWEVPVIREPLDLDGNLELSEFQQSNLPSVFYRDVDGRWRKDVVERYRDMWQKSRELFDKMMSGEGAYYSELITFASQVLGLRYRFNLLVHSRWPEAFLTTDNVSKVCHAAIGYGILKRHYDDQKKTQQTSA